MKPEVLEIVVDHLTSEQEMQSVAHGTRTITMSDGSKKKIAAVIRRHSNAQNIRQIKAILEELGLPIPSNSFLKKLLKNLPARRSRNITGIDMSYEHSRNSIQKLFDFTNDMLEAHPGVAWMQEVNDIKEGLSAYNTYLLSSFPYNIGKDSDCKSHCITFACSAADSADKEPCNVPHTKQCEHCNLFHQLQLDIKSLLEKVSDTLDPLAVEEWRYEIDHAFDGIAFYKSSLMKGALADQYWSSCFQKKDESVVHCTADFAMVQYF